MPKRLPFAFALSLSTHRAHLVRTARWVSALVVLGLLSSPAAAWADEPGDQASRAADLKRQGGVAMDKLEFSSAEEAYKKALELTPNDATLHYNLGKVHQARDNFPEALDELERFVRDASPELRAKVPRILETLAEVRQRVATLSLVCTEADPDAQVQLGAALVAKGCSPTATTLRVSIPPGKPETTLSVGSVKFRAQQIPLTLKSGSAIPVRMEMIARATSGTLRVVTQPMGATVYVDGQFRGNPPIEIYLKPGSHEVVAKLESYQDATLPVIVELGQTKDLTVPMSKGAPITQKWWFWTGVVTVVAAAVIVPSVIAANTEKDAIAGNLGAVGAPLRF